MKPGDLTTVLVNQGDRDATVLAVLGTKALIEYTMPAGSTGLQIIDLLTDAPTPGRSVGYRNLPTKWLQAVVDAGSSWEGNPQQTPARLRPDSPEAMLAARGGRKRLGHK